VLPTALANLTAMSSPGTLPRWSCRPGDRWWEPSTIRLACAPGRGRREAGHGLTTSRRQPGSRPPLRSEGRQQQASPRTARHRISISYHRGSSFRFPCFRGCAANRLSDISGGHESQGGIRPALGAGQLGASWRSSWTSAPSRLKRARRNRCGGSLRATPCPDRLPLASAIGLPAVPTAFASVDRLMQVADEIGFGCEGCGELRVEVLRDSLVHDASGADREDDERRDRRADRGRPPCRRPTRSGLTARVVLSRRAS
jgi:hypothetical protein